MPVHDDQVRKVPSLCGTKLECVCYFFSIIAANEGVSGMEACNKKLEERTK